MELSELEVQQSDKQIINKQWHSQGGGDIYFWNCS